MRADNTAHLVTAAKQRHEFTRAKTIQVLRELDQAGTRVTFEAVAREANVSRSWLYTQPDIKAEIQRLRTLPGRPNTPIPARQHGTDPSLRSRLEIANRRNKELTEENRRLRHQLEHALGQLRTHPPTPKEPPRKRPVTLDTTVLIDALRGKPAAARIRELVANREVLLTTSINVEE